MNVFHLKYVIENIEFVLIIASKYDTIIKLLYLYSKCNHKTAMFCRRISEEGTTKRFLNYFFSMEIFVLLYWYDKDLEYFDINIFIKCLHYIIDSIRGIFHKMSCWILPTELIFAMFPTKYGSDCANEYSFSCAFSL